MRIALIGSRSLEQKAEHSEDIKLCYSVAKRFADLGITFTSGLAELGMDGIAQKAYADSVMEGKANTSQFEVYVASQHNINRSTLPYKNLAIIRNNKLIAQTYTLCMEVMGMQHWNNCNDYAKGMHSRNCHQILGYDLKSPVDAVVCWTPEGKFIGGTRTALLIAQKENIPIFNLGLFDKNKVLSDIKDFLKLNKII